MFVEPTFLSAGPFGRQSGRSKSGFAQSATTLVFPRFLTVFPGKGRFFMEKKTGLFAEKYFFTNIQFLRHIATIRDQRLRLSWRHINMSGVLSFCEKLFENRIWMFRSLCPRSP